MDDSTGIINLLKQTTTILQRASIESRTDLALIRLRGALKAGYDPKQPRRRDGTAQSGWWTSGGHLNDVNRIVAAAQRFRSAAVSDRYSNCVDLCYPLLERRQPAGSDFNLWDYHKCLNRCLGR